MERSCPLGPRLRANLLLDDAMLDGEVKGLDVSPHR